MEKKQPKFQLNDIIRVADLRKTFSKGDTANWWYNISEITEIIINTIPTYRNDSSP